MPCAIKTKSSVLTMYQKTKMTETLEKIWYYTVSNKCWGVYFFTGHSVYVHYMPVQHNAWVWEIDKLTECIHHACIHTVLHSKRYKIAQLMQRGTRHSGACLKTHCEQNLSSLIPATDIGNDAFTYARWHHLLTWLLPYEWLNVSIRKGVPKFDAPTWRIPWILVYL